MSYFVIFDDPAKGGDGTFLTEKEDEGMWSRDVKQARIMVQTEAELALDDVDCAELLRHRLTIMPATHFKLPFPRVVGGTDG